MASTELVTIDALQKADSIGKKLAIVAKKVSELKQEEMRDGDSARVRLLMAGEGASEGQELPPDVIPVDDRLFAEMVTPTQAAMLQLLADRVRQAPGPGTPSFEDVQRIIRGVNRVPPDVKAPPDVFLYDHFPEMKVTFSGLREGSDDALRTERGGLPAVRILVRTRPGGKFVDWRSHITPPMWITGMELGTGGVRKDRTDFAHLSDVMQGQFQTWMSPLDATLKPTYAGCMEQYLLNKAVYMVETLYLVNLGRCADCNDFTPSMNAKTRGRVRTDNMRLAEGLADEEPLARTKARGELVAAVNARRKMYARVCLFKDLMDGRGKHGEFRCSVGLRRVIDLTDRSEKMLGQEVIRHLRGNPLHPPEEWTRLGGATATVLRNLPNVYKYRGEKVAGLGMLASDPSSLCGTTHAVSAGVVVLRLRIGFFPKMGVHPSLRFSDIILTNDEDWVPREVYMNSFKAAGRGEYAGSSEPVPQSFRRLAAGVHIELLEDGSVSGAGAGAGEGSPMPSPRRVTQTNGSAASPPRRARSGSIAKRTLDLDEDGDGKRARA